MLISISKLVLYTLCAGIHLNRTLPLVLDVRTDNHKLLNEDLYFSLQRPRVRGEKYDAFINRFIRTCRKRFPKHISILKTLGCKRQDVSLTSIIMRFLASMKTTRALGAWP